jgi:hypothetical protein
VTQTATLNVLKATPTVTWANPADITYGTPLGAAQLDATADAPGTFAYSPADGAVLSPGAQTLSVTFTPTDTADFTGNSVTLTVTLNVLAPPPTVTLGSDPAILSLSPIVEGAYQWPLTVQGQGFAPGSVLLVNGMPLATLFLDGTTLEVPVFLRQVQWWLRARRSHGRVAGFEEGWLAVQVWVPGVGVTAAVPLEVMDLVAPGDVGTAAERAVAESWEVRHQQEADTSPDFARILRGLRAHGI